MNHNDVMAIILGGGAGTRLFPLTLERAKPAVTFAGKYRLIDITLSNCINSGIKRVSVLTQFLSASLHRHIMRTYQYDNFTDGFIDILAAEQTPHRSDWFQGTADAVRATLSHTTYYKSSDMLILSGDHLYRMDYRELIDFHRRSNADITLGVYPVTREDAPRMGLVKAAAQGEVEEFTEKPKAPEVVNAFCTPSRFFESKGLPAGPGQCLASMGVYVFKPEALIRALSDSGQADFGKEVIPGAIGRFRLMAFPFAGYWMDIGTIASFFDANISLAQTAPPFELYYPRWPIYTRARSLPPVRVIGSEIRDSLLVEGSNITGARISDSVIGMRSIIQEGTRLDEAVIMGADFYEGEQLLSCWEDSENLPPLGIGKDCRIERVIIDKNVRIGNGVTIRSHKNEKDFEGKTHWIRDGITVIPKGAVIPSGTEI
jgi:glucose-1-phosphate adenylyltransferase